MDFSGLDVAEVPAELLSLARETWAWRVGTELRSAQVMARFVSEVLGAGDPLEVYAGAADAVMDEIRHAALCVATVEALGGVALSPDPLEEPLTAEFLALPMAQRALTTALTMLAVAETVSVALVEDLRERCGQPAIRAVLDATIADEADHRELGWAYVEASLGRFDVGDLPYWRQVAAMAVEDQLRGHAALLASLSAGRRSLEAWPEPGLAELGLLSPPREALLVAGAIEQSVLPRLRALELA